MHSKQKIAAALNAINEEIAEQQMQAFSDAHIAEQTFSYSPPAAGCFDVYSIVEYFIDTLGENATRRDIATYEQEHTVSFTPAQKNEIMQQYDTYCLEQENDPYSTFNKR